jgi:hypothetical protein
MARATRSVGRHAFGGVAALLVAALASSAHGQSTTQPTAASAAGATPKAAVKAFVTAEIKGDSAAIKQVLLTTTPTEQRMAGAIADLAVAIADLDQAMVAKFGASATEPLMGNRDAILADISAKLDKATESVHGDTATVTSSPDAAGPIPGAAAPTDPATGGGPSPQDVMTLKRVDGQWKVSVSDLAKGSSSENVERTLSSVDAGIAGYRSVLADLNAGKLTSVDAVAAALNAKMMGTGAMPPPGAPGVTPPPTAGAATTLPAAAK